MKNKSTLKMESQDQEHNLTIYNLVRAVPENAKKKIGAGRLKGKTDINPQWRIKKLTELYGPIGLGWYVKTIKEEVVNCPNQEILYFVNIELYVKNNDNWSMPIEGSGGSKIVSKESKGLYVDDDAKKKAKTDALGKACQFLGIGADIYWENDKSKYNNPEETSQVKYATMPQIKRMFAIARNKNFTDEAIKIFISCAFNIESTKQLNTSQYDQLIKFIENYKNEKIVKK